MKIARVFPSRTSMTPVDELAFRECPPPGLALPDIDEVHVSVTFTWDLPWAEQLAEAWRVLGVPVRMGGPAFNAPGGAFIPGRYLREGMVITSRGCPNRCWFCAVPKREGGLRELPITEGWNVLDDNLLACSDDHVRAVFDMLARQDRPPVFSGGLEAKLLKPWHAERLRELHADRMYFAYDTPDDYEPLVEAGKILRAAGFQIHGHRMRCYVLVGYPGDTLVRAQNRLEDTIRAGFMPFAMLYRDRSGARAPEWIPFTNEWVKPQIVGTKMREIEQADEIARKRGKVVEA